MGELISLDEYRNNKLSQQFDAPKKKKKNKQDIREKRENEIDEAISRHPSKGRPKKFKDDE